MEHRALGRSGVDVSRIILGCGNFGGIGSSPAFFGAGETEAEAHALLDAAWEAGITTYDTADAYGGGRSETYLGNWLRSQGPEVRDRIVLTTKTFNPMSEGADSGLAPERIERQLASSLERLGVDAVDLYLPHAMDDATPVAETVGAFEELVAKGSIRAYGGSNVDADWLEEALRHGRPAWVQNSHSLLERDDETGVLSVVVREGLGYTPFSPLAGGWLTGKYRRDEEPPAGSRMTLRPEPYRHLEDGRVFDALEAFEAIAQRTGHDPCRARDRLAARSSARHRRRHRPAPPRPAPPGARRAPARPLPARARAARGAVRMSRPRPRRARGPLAADDGRVRRGDGRGAALARPRRAAPAAPARHASRGLGHPDGPHARLPRRRAAGVVAEGDRDRPRQPRPRPGRAPGRRPAPRRRDRRAAGAPERLRDHRDPHGRGVGRRDPRARSGRKHASSRSSAAASRRARTTRRCAPCWPRPRSARGPPRRRHA